MKTVVFTAQAARDVDGLPLASRLAFEKAVSRFITTGEGDVAKLAGREAYRSRVGDYRMIFEMTNEQILAVYFGRRQTIRYRR